MEAVVLAGIARRVLDDLLKSPYRTVELRSARNIYATERAEKENKWVFLAYEPFSDVRSGTEGLIAELLKREVMETRVPWEESDEREVTVCRIQIHLLGLGRIVEVTERNTLVMAKVRRMMTHEMAMG
jgi:hypothetical protein